MGASALSLTVFGNPVTPFAVVRAAPVTPFAVVRAAFCKGFTGFGILILNSSRYVIGVTQTFYF